MSRHGRLRRRQTAWGMVARVAATIQSGTALGAYIVGAPAVIEGGLLRLMTYGGAWSDRKQEALAARSFAFEDPAKRRANNGLRVVADVD